MFIEHLHDWTVTPPEAIDLQKRLAERILHHHPIHLDAVKFVAGVDVSVKKQISQAAVVILTYPALEIVEVSRAQLPTTYPYIPGLLTFREGPVLEIALQQVQQTPDVLIFDGMGRIHPRRIGIASHMGLWLNKPTIGCGKTHFIGQYAEPANERGAMSPLMLGNEQLGVVLRTRDNVKPVYISVGHLADIDSAIALTLRCTTHYRLPEPIRRAHHAAGEFG